MTYSSDMAITQKALERQARHDRIIQDLIRACPNGAENQTLHDVTQIPRRDLNRAMVRLKEHGTIELRTVHGTDRWFVVAHVGLTRGARTG